MRLTGTGVLAVGALALLGILGAVAWWQRDAIGKAIDPRNADNIANQAASAIVQNVVGSAAEGGEDSVGGLFARAREFFSGDDARIRDMLKGGTPPPPAYVTPTTEAWNL